MEKENGVSTRHEEKSYFPVCVNLTKAHIEYLHRQPNASATVRAALDKAMLTEAKGQLMETVRRRFSKRKFASFEKRIKKIEERMGI